MTVNVSAKRIGVFICHCGGNISTVVDVDKLKSSESDTVEIDRVLMCVDGEKVLIGKPYLDNVKVTAKNVGEIKGKKVLGVKFKKRKNYTRTIGHRQQYTQLKIEKVAIA